MPRVSWIHEENKPHIPNSVPDKWEQIVVGFSRRHAPTGPKTSLGSDMIILFKIYGKSRDIMLSKGMNQIGEEKNGNTQMLCEEKNHQENKDL